MLSRTTPPPPPPIITRPRTALAAFIDSSGDGGAAAMAPRKRAKKAPVPPPPTTTTAAADAGEAPAAAAAAAAAAAVAAAEPRNEFLESLFTACEEEEEEGEHKNNNNNNEQQPAAAATTTTTATAAAAAAAAARRALASAFSLGGGSAAAAAADNSSLTRAARANYTASNPHFDTERLLVPYTGPVLHNGSEVLPGERIIQVARFGRIYKRKSPMSTILRNRPGAPPGTRYCKICHAFQPEAAFYTHIRRYVCKRHHAERVDRYRHSHDATEQVAVDMWFALKEQCCVLGYLNPNFDAQDIRSLMIHAGIPFSMKVSLMPIDPSIPMRPRNVAIVAHHTFKHICKGYEHMCSRALFIAQVQRCNLLPAGLDAGWPENPWHDPHYRRQDIDVGPLLLAELQGPLDCTDRSVLEALLADEPKTPWIRDAASAVPLGIAMRERRERNAAKRELLAKQPPAAAEEAEEVVDAATARERRRQADAAAVAAAAVAPRQRCTSKRVKL